jgi:hypothetical protein
MKVRIMKRIFTTALMFLLFHAVQGQALGREYRTAIGLKVWDGAGLSIKHFTNDKAALEGIAYIWEKGFRITGLYEFHGDIGGAPGLKWYVGPGAHIGFYDNDNDNNNEGAEDTYFGIDGVLGLDFKFNKVPINISIDWQPVFEFGEGRGFYGNWGGLGIRYAFGN